MRIIQSVTSKFHEFHAGMSPCNLQSTVRFKSCVRPEMEF